MFKLDHRIERDSILLTKLPLCQLRLQNDQRYPWLVLVPEAVDEHGQTVTEVHDLSERDASQLLKESNAVAEVLKKVTGCKKINIANLGNVVEQLHWHIVARNENDITWPGPIWGVGNAIPWDEKKRHQLVVSLLESLSQKGFKPSGN